MIACGGYHTVIQNEKKEIYVCGNNYSGQLGLGDDKYRNSFEKLEYYFGEIKNIACGYCHTVVQTVKNEIYVCGNNRYGQLGLGDKKDRNKFEKVKKNFGKIKNIACGGFYTIIQNEKNEIFVCGYNGYGQLGLGDHKDRNKFERVKYSFGEIKNIACGSNHTVIRDEENWIYACGLNQNGQLGLGHRKNQDKFRIVICYTGNIKNIVCGGRHTIIQNENDEIYACGYNGFGQLNSSHDRNIYSFERVEHDFGKIKKKEHCGLLYKIYRMSCSLFFWNKNKSENTDYELNGIKKIVCGEYHIMVQNKKNEIYVRGNNYHGQLGLGDNKSRDRFEKVEYNFGLLKNIACGGHHTIIQNEKDEIYVCGLNYFGQLGLGYNYNKNRNKFEKIDIDNVFERIYNLEFQFQLNTEGIVL